jgi:hypothetical protein
VRLNLNQALPVPIGGFSTEILPAIQAPDWSIRLTGLVGAIGPKNLLGEFIGEGTAQGTGSLTIQASPNLPAVLTGLTISPTYTIRIFNGSSLTHQSSGNFGPLVARFAQAPPAPRKVHASIESNELTLGAMFDQQVVFLIGPQGFPAVPGTRIEVTTEQTQIPGGEPLTLASLARVELRTQGIQTLGVTNVVVSAPVGCAGNCGGQSQSGCWCDPACVMFGDCCADVCQHCTGLPGCNPCPADLNGDTLVNGLDLGILLINWSIPPGTPGCGGATPCPADLNGNGFVDGLDLGILLGQWGPCT